MRDMVSLWKRLKNVSKSAWFRLFLMAYIFLPVICFAYGWLSIYIAVPVSILVVYGSLRFVKTENEIRMPSKKELSGISALVIIVIAVCWCVLSGIGGAMYQNPDHWWRNRLFAILVEKDWPVLITEADRSRMLCYYIGFYLPAAVIGKIFGLGAGFVFQLIWALIGILLFFALLGNWQGRWGVGMILAFVFFSGLNVFSYKPADIINPVYHLEQTAFQFSSHTSQLFWVHNQAIYAWILTLTILLSKKNGQLVLLWSTGLLTCTLPFLGMLPLVIYSILRNAGESQGVGRRIAEGVKNTLTIENILGGGTIGIVTFLYLAGGAGGLQFHFTEPLLLFFLPGCLVEEIGLYAGEMHKQYKKEKLLVLSTICLIIIPFFGLGSANDFCTRVSIPCLLVFFLYVYKELSERLKTHRISLLLLLFLAGAIIPVHEIARSIDYTFFEDEPKVLEEIGIYAFTKADGTELIKEQDAVFWHNKYFLGEQEIMDNPQYSCDADNSFFVKYLMKQSE